MYRYDSFDQRVIDERVAQFRDQTRRFLAGELPEDDFRPLRLQNGLYIQKHAPMLRIAIPYGQLSTRQLRKLAHLGRTYDRGYGHFTTRQNLQFNWPQLADVPDILAELAKVEMHAIQTSGNCIRNVTSDHFAGVAADETVDPRPYAELIRQWSTLHPEFAYLPRKFKIAVTGAVSDRAALAKYLEDVGETDALYLRENLVHPGQILRLCNAALVQNVILGPWIHVGSRVRNFALARVGDELTVRSRILSNLESKGHDIVEFDAMVVANGRTVVAEIIHTAIWRPRHVKAAA